LLPPYSFDEEKKNDLEIDLKRDVVYESCNLFLDIESIERDPVSRLKSLSWRQVCCHLMMMRMVMMTSNDSPSEASKEGFENIRSVTDTYKLLFTSVQLIKFSLLHQKRS